MINTSFISFIVDFINIYRHFLIYIDIHQYFLKPYLWIIIRKLQKISTFLKYSAALDRDKTIPGL